MRYSATVDVPHLADGIAFYGAVFDFREIARPFPTYVILGLGEARLGIMEKEAGTSPAPGSDDVRTYSRHWTPVHLDFHVDDFANTLARAQDAGATIEHEFPGEGHPPAAFCADPFGNGFCIIGAS